jgi:predicted acylesterase/phospholipase RssA
MVIKHLVISGGGPTGLLSYGAAKYLEKNKFWNIDNVKSIYGTSIGAVIGIILSLKHTWETIDDYIVKCPWNTVLPLNTTFDDVLNIYTNKGIIPEEFFDIIMKPLLLSKDLSLNTTMSELYEYNKKEIHVMSVELNKFRLINISYKTHPNLKVMDAIKMSCAFPVIFSPKIMESCDNNGENPCTHCYIDGGVMSNYPVNTCIEDQKCDPNEILGFRNIWEKYKDTINHDSNLVDFLKMCIKQMIRKIDNEESIIKILNEVTDTLYIYIGTGNFTDIARFSSQRVSYFLYNR